MCNPEREMQASQSVAEIRTGMGLLVLGVDTCGPSGSVALARLEGASANILGQRELAGRSYSATLVAAVGGLLAEHGAKLADVGAIVVVSGPGSFTGVRVGLSAVKGLAEPGQIPVVAVSRLAVLAAKAGVTSAALDAHRHEVFLRLAGSDGSVRELLAGVEELASWIGAQLCGQRKSRSAMTRRRASSNRCGLGQNWFDVKRRRRRMRLRFACRRSCRGSLPIWRCWMGIICGVRMRRFSATMRPLQRCDTHEHRIGCPHSLDGGGGSGSTC